MKKEEFLKLTKAKQIDYIKEQLKVNDQWLIKGLIRIYERQTALEQMADQTTDANGVGFSGADGEFMSVAAKRAMNGYVFSPKYLTAIRKNMIKYAGQLARVSRGEV